jgi:hypothetical protein
MRCRPLLNVSIYLPNYKDTLSLITVVYSDKTPNVIKLQNYGIYTRGNRCEVQTFYIGEEILKKLGIPSVRLKDKGHCRFCNLSHNNRTQ